MLRDMRMVLESGILPALAADGGGLELVGRHEKQVMIRYVGACGSCPASLTGTLVAIEGMLQKEVDPGDRGDQRLNRFTPDEPSVPPLI